jgi:hypothetical protein
MTCTQADDEDLDSILQDADVLIGDALLIAEYVDAENEDEITEGTSESEGEEEYKQESPKPSTPPRQKEAIVFDYQRPQHHPQRGFEQLSNVPEPVRASNKDILLHRLELQNNRILEEYEKSGKDRFSRQYQSVNHQIRQKSAEEQNLIFKTRSKIIRTPQDNEETSQDNYEKVTFGDKNNSRASHLENYEDLRASEASRVKPKSKPLIPDFSTAKKSQSSATSRKIVTPKQYKF